MGPRQIRELQEFLNEMAKSGDLAGQIFDYGWKGARKWLEEIVYEEMIKRGLAEDWDDASLKIHGDEVGEGVEVWNHLAGVIERAMAEVKENILNLLWD